MALIEQYSEVVAGEQALLTSVKAQHQAHSDAKQTWRTVRVSACVS